MVSVVAVTLTSLLSRTFKGELSVGRIDRANLRGVVAADFVVTDRYGQVVLRASRVRARANLPALLEEVLFGGRRLDLAVRNVRIERVDVYVLPDPRTGIPTIAEAFTPEPSEPDPPGTPKQSARPLRVWLPTIEIGRIWGRVVIEGVDTDEAAGEIVVACRPRANAARRCGHCGRRAGRYDQGEGRRRWRAPGRGDDEGVHRG